MNPSIVRDLTGQSGYSARQRRERFSTGDSERYLDTSCSILKIAVVY